MAKQFIIPSGSKQLDWKVAIKRENELPLDISSVFSSLEDAKKYVSGIDTRRGKSYVGQIIAVSTTKGVDIYKVEDNTSEDGLVNILKDVDLSKYYTAEQVDEKINSISLAQFISSFDKLPSGADAVDNKIYIVGPASDDEGNKFVEYIYNKDAEEWEKIGEFKADITIDDAINANSSNPVQNRAIAEAIEQVYEDMGDIVAGDLSEALKAYVKDVRVKDGDSNKTAVKDQVATIDLTNIVRTNDKGELSISPISDNYLTELSVNENKISIISNKNNSETDSKLIVDENGVTIKGGNTNVSINSNGLFIGENIVATQDYVAYLKELENTVIPNLLERISLLENKLKDVNVSDTIITNDNINSYIVGDGVTIEDNWVNDRIELSLKDITNITFDQADIIDDNYDDGDDDDYQSF